MFDRMALLIEENKIKTRFNSGVSSAILDVINKEKNEEHLNYIFQMLVQFNKTVDMMDHLLFESADNSESEDGFSDEEWQEFQDDVNDKYIHALINSFNKLYFRLGKADFLKQYSDAYWKYTQNMILKMWTELPNGKLDSEDSLFIKIFEDFFKESVKSLPGFMTKQLREFSNLHRASRYEVFDNYKYIMPDPDHCNNNRWNEDGIANLYLSYDNDNTLYQGIRTAQKTCFEELRAKNDEQIAVCKFKPLHRRVKILDLSYDGIDYENELRGLDDVEDSYKEKIMDTIMSKPKVFNRLVGYAQEKKKDEFEAEVGKIQKKLGIDKATYQKVQETMSRILIGNICDSIFYAVDKETDPDLEAYIPFRCFRRYLISKGFSGVAYRSTRMQLLGLQGKCLILFDVDDATYVDGSMEVYEYHTDGCKLLKKY